MIYSTIKYHFTFIKMIIIKKEISVNEMEKSEPHALELRMQNGKTAIKTLCCFFKKLNIESA